MASAFASPKGLISHARDEIKDAAKLADEWATLQTGSKVVNRDSTTGEYVHCIQVKGPDLPLKIANVIKDAAGNLRDALDHAVYAATVAIVGGKPTNTGFPFAGDAKGVDGELDGKRLSGNAPEIRSVLAGFKPYPGGNDALWALNQIRNPNTHRFIVPVGHAASMNSLSIIGGRIEGGLIFKGPQWDPAKKQIEYLRTTGQARLNDQVRISFVIAFEGIEAVAGKNAFSTLELMVAEVERCVNAIETECRRLGFIS